MVIQNNYDLIFNFHLYYSCPREIALSYLPVHALYCLSILVMFMLTVRKREIGTFYSWFLTLKIEIV